MIGDLEPTGEEHECAVYLERMPEVKAWVRNTSQQPNSFWLQTTTDKFYPDFVALLPDGRYLVIEYKGSYIASADDANEKEKRLIGEVWADRLGGTPPTHHPAKTGQPPWLCHPGKRIDEHFDRSDPQENAEQPAQPFGVNRVGRLGANRRKEHAG